MFSFFKRSKSQKGKQKHEKLQLPPEPQPVEDEPEEPVLPPSESPVVAAKVVASDAHAGAPLTSHAGDEENRPKNTPTQPQPFAPTPPTGPPLEPRQLLPSKWPTSGGKGEGTEAHQGDGSRAYPSGTISVEVSASDPTRQNGSVRNDDGGGDRETSTNDGNPIDDSAGCGARETQPTSSYPYAPQSESAMAKGKNRRRYQQPQQQQQQQQQQQTVKVQHQNGLKLSLPRDDSSGDHEKVCQQQAKTQLSNLAKAMGIVTVDPIKVIGGIERGVEHLTNGDVTKHDHESRTRTRTSEPNDRSGLAKTHTNGDGGESVALVSQSACADAPPPQLTAVTNTSDTTAIAPDKEHRLLNIKNISPTVHEHSEAGDRPVVVGRRSEAASAATGSSEANANLAISEANAVVTEPTEAIQEMGQQPSRESQRSQSPRSKSSPSPPQPPPRAGHQRPLPVPVPAPLDVETVTRHATQIVVVQDAAGDDTSDDRDVFYEAAESVSPAADGTPEAARRVGNPSSATGTPEPIRGSLVLKITEPSPECGGVQGREKKQVSFKLTQNGSDDVEVTSVDSSDVDSDSEGHAASDSVAHNHTAFSERNNSNPATHPPVSYGICAFPNAEISEPAEVKGYIEFQYDHSAPGPDGKNGSEVERDDGVGDVDKGKDPVLIEDSVASLPDVVQPSNIEPSATFNTVEKINSEM